RVAAVVATLARPSGRLGWPDGGSRVRRLFFFQAEDGIRDGHVTGVQTYALPIWRARRASGWESRAWTARAARTRRRWTPWRPSRSEERRVGKECRSRLWWQQEKKERTLRSRGGTFVWW